MKTQIIALEAHDDFISVRDRMSWAKSPRILLVWPKYEKVTLRPADLRILQQHAVTLGAEMGIITRRGDVRRDAERFGIPVFRSAAAAQRQVWGAPRRMKLDPGRQPRERAAMDALRAAARPAEAAWRNRPLARVGFFVIGVLAVLAITALFVPEASIDVVPASQQQALSLPVTASESNQAVAVAGSVPLHKIIITVSASQSARVTTQSSIPDQKARGIARFTNLSASALTIPQGTIVYSVSPFAAQFATANDTHLPGNINAVVEVPITAIKGGAEANLPSNAIQAIQGSLNLSAAVTNLEPTEGGTDRMAAAPSEADRKRLRDVVVGLLQSQALAQLTESIGAGDVLLPSSLRMGEVHEELYNPAPGQPGNLLTLAMRVDYTVNYLRQDELRQLAELALRSSRPAGFVPVEGSLEFKLAREPAFEPTAGVHFVLQVSQTLVREVDTSRANALVRGLPADEAARSLEDALPLAGSPRIKMSPPWWPWMPVIPFRITVSAGQP